MRAVLRDGSDGRGARGVPARRCGARATTATRSCGRSRRATAGRTCPRSRCSRWAADRTLPATAASRHDPSSTGLSTARGQPVDSGPTIDRRFVDKRVDPLRGRPITVRLARRGRQDRRSRDHIKEPSFRRRSLRALRCPHRAAVSPRPARVACARRDAIGIPVSILPSGGRSRGPRPSSPGRDPGGPHVRSR